MNLPKRKQIRLSCFDYFENGYYFVTICTKDRKHILSKVNNTPVGANCVRPSGEIKLSKFGIIIDNELKKINQIYPTIFLDEYVIMPNHIHLIIMIQKDKFGQTQFAPTISRIIKQFKGSVTKQIGKSIWQKSFYEHIIRDENDLYEIRKYIIGNPLKWELDRYY